MAYEEQYMTSTDGHFYLPFFHHLSRFVLEPKSVLMNEQEQKLKDSESASGSLQVIFCGHVKLFVHASASLDSFVFICVHFSFQTVIFLIYYWSKLSFLLDILLIYQNHKAC